MMAQYSIVDKKVEERIIEAFQHRGPRWAAESWPRCGRLHT